MSAKTDCSQYAKKKILKGPLFALSLISLVLSFTPGAWALPILKPVVAYSRAFASVPFLFEGRPVETGPITASLDPSGINTFGFDSDFVGGDFREQVRGTPFTDVRVRLDFPFLHTLGEPQPKIRLTSGSFLDFMPNAAVDRPGGIGEETFVEFQPFEGGEITSGFFAGVRFAFFDEGGGDLRIRPDDGDEDTVPEWEAFDTYSLITLAANVSFPEHLGGELVEFFPGGFLGDVSFTVGERTVPEPTTFALIGIGFLGLLACSRRIT